MFDIAKSVLLIIDVQGRLAAMVHNQDRILNNIYALIKAAQILDIPIIHTEQVPEKIGSTIESVAYLLKDHPRPITKKSFSCCGSAAFQQRLKALKRKQLIVAGIETHVCVYQTVQDLLAAKYQVQVVCDGVSSRVQENTERSLARMQSLGAGLTTAEMIIMELVRTSEHKKFKEILQLIK